MMRLHRFLPSVVVACCAVSLPVFGVGTALAQDQEQEASDTAAAQPAATSLKDSAEGFWHYAKTFRYDLANAEAKKILEANPQPVELLKAFQQVSSERKDNLDQWMLRWQQVAELRESVNGLLAILNQGQNAQRADQNLIEKNIQALTGNEQAYSIAVRRLSESGELAIPLMIQYLQDPSRAQYQGAIQQAFVDMKQTGVSPLVAALEMPANEKNIKALLSVIGALGTMGYDVSVAPLADLAASNTAPAAVKQAASQALLRMGAAQPGSANVAELYYDIAQKYYYRKASTSPNGKSNVAYLWSWNERGGLEKQDVPAAIWGDLMTLRATRKSLQHSPNRDEVLALWLSADYGREVHLPQGATDPTVSAATPKAHYYGVAAGAKCLNMVINRALGDRDTATVFAAIKSLQQIGGQSNLFASGQAGALVAAMQYPDRLVRFEAAFAAAAALPQTAFEGQDRVVPILAEAVVQTGQPYVLVVMPEQQLNGRVQELKDAGYVAAGSTTAEGAAGTALPAVDAIIVSDADPAQVETMVKVAAATPRLQGSAIVIQTKTQASPFTVLATTNPKVTVTQATDAAGLKAALEEARKKAGSMPVDAKVATDYALRATELLNLLARSRGQILDLSGAQEALLAALNDARGEEVVAAANALAMMNTRPAQQALLIKAVDAQTEAKMKISIYNALSTSAKFFGNQLEADQVKQLQQAVAAEQDLAVRSAAAEAHGALNLPADQVKALLLK